MSKRKVLISHLQEVVQEINNFINSMPYKLPDNPSTINLIAIGKDVQLSSNACKIKSNGKYHGNGRLYVNARFPLNQYSTEDLDKQIANIMHKLNQVTEIGFDQGFTNSYLHYKDKLSVNFFADETILILDGYLCACIDIVFTVGGE